MARMRVFAGPNGSGKTTLNQYLKDQVNLGIYLNPDDFFTQISRDGILDIERYGITANPLDWNQFRESHSLNDLLATEDAEVEQRQGRLIFSKTPSVYLVSIVIDYVRHLLLEPEKTFSFETVFSHKSKVELLKKAEGKGYRTYLYFVCTKSPEINVYRVLQRTREGGHDVPEEKIRSRYDRSLSNLAAGIKIAYRTYLFDNSGRSASLFAEVTPKKQLTLHKEAIPQWFVKYVFPIFF